MEAKQTSTKGQLPELLADEAEYFKYIFKKTEKIICAVFYILRTHNNFDQKDTLVLETERAVQRLMDSAFGGLRASYAYRNTHLDNLSFGLLEIETRLRILSSAQLLQTDLLDVFLHEIDSVQRTIKRYRKHDVINPIFDTAIESALTGSSTRRERVFRQQNGVSATRVDIEATHTNTRTLLPNRRERIIAILKDKGEATIKDISEHITDCSEKTVQRELIDLIKDNKVVRYGERRWSKYSAL